MATYERKNNPNQMHDQPGIAVPFSRALQLQSHGVHRKEPPPITSEVGENYTKNETSPFTG
jgi:hypothetical protein